jgi:hypothetical protein
LSNLKPGSKFIFTIKDRDRYNPIQEDWLTDWTFVPRAENDVKILLEKVGAIKTNVTFSRGDSGIIIFIEMTKK